MAPYDRRREDLARAVRKTPLDALLVINYLNDHASQSPPIQPVGTLIISSIQLDVDGDGEVAAQDALLIINRLNLRPVNSTLSPAIHFLQTDTEGESPAPSDQLDPVSMDLLLGFGQSDQTAPSSGSSTGPRAR